MLKLNRSHLIAAAAVPLAVVLISVVLILLRGRSPAARPPTAPTPATQVSADPAPNDPTRLAVTTPQFDDVGQRLVELGDGYRHDRIDVDQLRDAKVRARYVSIFLTCAEPVAEGEAPDFIEGLRTFVSEGGTLYASDLWYDSLAAAFPEKVDRVSVGQGLKQEIRAEVTSPELREVLGAEIPLHFQQDGWRPAAFRGDDVTIFLKGRLKTTAGVEIVAPLLVKFPFGKGTVVFTSFHNEERNSETEVKLLKFLVLKTVTSRLESRLTSALVDAGFAPRESVALSADPDAAPVTRVYQHTKVGALQFRLGFEKPGAKLRLDVVSPAGRRTTERGDSNLTIEIPDALPGRWQYTATFEAVPYPEFPTVLLVGTEDASGGSAGKKASPVPAETSGNIVFQEIFLGGKNAEAPAHAPRIAVSVPAEYDDMGKLLVTLGSGFQFTSLTLDELLEPAALEPFDLLFLTCRGAPESWVLSVGDKAAREGMVTVKLDPVKTARFSENLRQFVTRGGTLYASDLTRSRLTEAFPSRDPGIALDETLLPEIDQAERQWIQARDHPLTSIGTVSEVLQNAGLSAELRKRQRQLVAAFEASGLVEGTLNEMTEADVEKYIREWLAFIALPAIDSDVAAIKKSLTDWEEAIIKATRMHTPRKLAQLRGQVEYFEKKLERLRKQLLAFDDRGAKEQTVKVEIIEPGLRDLLGQSYSLSFKDNGWMPANFRGDDVTVLLRGEYRPISGSRVVAPLLVKFREGQGTVIFTSFHNEAQNSDKELDLLRYLVFSAVTAKQDALAQESMLSGGFSPVKQSQINHGEGHASVTKSYQSADSRPLRFALSFSGQGARLRLTLIAPDGQKYEKEAESTLQVEATGAPAGEWSYTVEALKVPYENFPYNVSIGKGTAPPEPGSTR